MLPLKILILLFLGKGYYMSFLYANLINSLVHIFKTKLTNQIQLVE